MVLCCQRVTHGDGKTPEGFPGKGALCARGGDRPQRGQPLASVPFGEYVVMVTSTQFMDEQYRNRRTQNKRLMQHDRILIPHQRYGQMGYGSIILSLLAHETHAAGAVVPL